MTINSGFGEEKRIKIGLDTGEYNKGVQTLIKSNKDIISTFEGISGSAEEFNSTIEASTFQVRGLVDGFSKLDDIALNKASSPFIKLEQEASSAQRVFEELKNASTSLDFKLLFGEGAKEVDKFADKFGEFADDAEDILAEDGLWGKFTESVQKLKPQRLLKVVNEGLEQFQEILKGIGPEFTVIVDGIEKLQGMLGKANLGLTAITTMENVEDTIKGIGNAASSAVEAGAAIAGIAPQAATATAAITGMTGPLGTAQAGFWGLQFVAKGTLKEIAQDIANLPIFQITAAVQSMSTLKDVFTDLNRITGDFNLGLEAVQISGANAHIIEYAKNLGIVGENLLFDINATKELVAVSVSSWQQLEMGIQQIRTLGAASGTSIGQWAEDIQNLVNNELQNAVKSSEIIGNIYQAISAGAKDASTALKQVEIAAKVASATGSDLQLVQEGLIFAGNAMGESMDNAGKIAAKLKITVDEAVLSMQDMVSIASSNLSSITSAGIEADKALADIAAASKTRGSEAGLAIQRLAESLSNLTPQAEETAKQYGLNIKKMFKDGKSLAEITQEISKAVGGNIEAMRTIIPETIAWKGATALLNTDLEQQEKVIESLRNATEEEVDALFKESQKTIAARADSVAKGFEEYFTKMGQQFLENGLFDKGIATLEAFLDKLQNSSPMVQTVIGGIVQLNYGLEKLFSILGQVAKITLSLIGTLAVFNFMNILKAIKLATVTFMDTSIAMNLVQKSAFALNNIMRALLGAELMTAEAFAATNYQLSVRSAWGKGLIAQKMAAIKAWWAETIAIEKNTQAQIANTASEKANMEAEKANTVTRGASTVVEAMGPASELGSVASTIQKKWHYLTESIKTGSEQIKTALTSIPNAVAKSSNSMVTSVKGGFEKITAFLAFIPILANKSFRIFSFGLKGITTLGSKAFSVVKTSLSGLLGSISAAAASLAIVVALFKDLFSLFSKREAKKMAEDMSNLGTAASIAASKIKLVEEEVKESGRIYESAFVNFFITPWEWLSKKILQTINFIISVPVHIVKALATITENLLGFIPGLDVITGAVKEAMDQILGWLKTATENLTESFNWIKNRWESMVNADALDEYYKGVHKVTDAILNLKDAVLDLEKGQVDTNKVVEEQKKILAELYELKNKALNKGNNKEAAQANAAIAAQEKKLKEIEEKAAELEKLEQLAFVRPLDIQEIEKRSQLQSEFFTLQKEGLENIIALEEERLANTRNPEMKQAIQDRIEGVKQELDALNARGQAAIEAHKVEATFINSLKASGKTFQESADDGITTIKQSIQELKKELENQDAVARNAADQNIKSVNKQIDVIQELREEVDTVSGEVGKLAQRQINQAMNSFTTLQQAILDASKNRDKDGNYVGLDLDALRADIQPILDEMNAFAEYGLPSAGKKIIEALQEQKVAIATASSGVVETSVLDIMTPEQIGQLMDNFNSILDAELNKLTEDTKKKLSELEHEREMGKIDTMEYLTQSRVEQEKFRDAELAAMNERIKMVKQMFGEDSIKYKDLLEERESMIRNHEKQIMDSFNSTVEAELNKLNENTKKKLAELEHEREMGRIDTDKYLAQSRIEQEKFRETELNLMNERIKMVRKMFGEDNIKYKNLLQEKAAMLRNHEKQIRDEQKQSLEAQFEKFKSHQDRILAETDTKLAATSTEALNKISAEYGNILEDIAKAGLSAEDAQKKQIQVAKDLAVERIKILRQELKGIKEGTEAYNQKLTEIAKAQKELITSTVEELINEVNKELKKIEVDIGQENLDLSKVIQQQKELAATLELQNEARTTELNTAMQIAKIRQEERQIEIKRTGDLVQRAKLEYENAKENAELQRQELQNEIEAKKLTIKTAKIQSEINKAELTSKELGLKLKIKELELEARIAQIKGAVTSEEKELMNQKIESAKLELNAIGNEKQRLEARDKLAQKTAEAELAVLERRQQLVSSEGAYAIEEAKQNILIAQMEKRLQQHEVMTKELEIQAQLNDQISKKYEIALQKQNDILSKRQELLDKITGSYTLQSNLLNGLIKDDALRGKREEKLRDKEIEFLKVKQQIELQLFDLSQKQEKMALRRQEIEARTAMIQQRAAVMQAEIEARRVALRRDATEEEKRLAELNVIAARQSLAASQENYAYAQEQVREFERMAEIQRTMFKIGQEDAMIQARVSALNPNGDFAERRRLREELEGRTRDRMEMFKELRDIIASGIQPERREDNRTAEAIDHLRDILVNQEERRRLAEEQTQLSSEDAIVRPQQINSERQVIENVRQSLERQFNQERTVVVQNLTVEAPMTLKVGNKGDIEGTPEAILDKMNDHLINIWTNVNEKLRSL